MWRERVGSRITSSCEVPVDSYEITLCRVLASIYCDPAQKNNNTEYVQGGAKTSHRPVSVKTFTNISHKLHVATRLTRFSPVFPK